MNAHKPDLPWPEGLRHTLPRERLLAALYAADRPLAVQQLLAAICSDGGPTVWLSTVYRALESFEACGVVIRTPMPDGSQAVYELNRHGHRHYAFCVGCSKMVAVERCPVDPDAARLADKGFQITGHKLEVYGYCADCQKKGVAPKS